VLISHHRQDPESTLLGRSGSPGRMRQPGKNRE
jgi:hypothetical protein